MSNLLTTALAELDEEYAAKRAKTLASIATLNEAEALHAALSAAGCTTPPSVVPHSYSPADVFFYDYGRHGDMRAALASAGVEIETERPVDGGRVTALTLRGLTCQVWLCAEAKPIALAA